MKMDIRKLGLIILSLILLVSLPFPVLANDGHDWMSGDLRVDLPEVSNSMDYRVWILANGSVNSWDSTTSFTTAWLSVDLPVFFQVGIKVDNQGYRWFAMTDDPQIQCLQGNVWITTPPYRGCYGNPNIWVTPGHFQEFELVSYGDGFWIARVYEANGVPHDVAKFPSSSHVINQAPSTFEQAWGGYDSNPYLPAVYTFWHPQYMIWGQGFQDWPNSTNTHKSLIYPSSTTSTNFCPNDYGAVWNFGNEPRTWYAGTSLSGENMVCNAVLFMFNFLPLIQKL